MHHGLMIVCTGRGNEVAYGHYLSVILREMEANETKITKICLENLDKTQIATLIAVYMQELPEQHVKHLASIAKEHTGGNIFFLFQFLSVLP